MFPHALFPIALFPGTLFPPVSGSSLPADLLACLVDFLATTSSVLDALDGGTISEGAGPANSTTPFVVVSGYDEAQPGLSSEDSKIEVSILVRAPGLDQCRAIATAIKTALDSATINPRAAGRNPFVWSTGQEYAVLRDDSKAERIGALAKNGPYAYREQIEYEFWVSPVQ